MYDMKIELNIDNLNISSEDYNIIDNIQSSLETQFDSNVCDGELADYPTFTLKEINENEYQETVKKLENDVLYAKAETDTIRRRLNGQLTDLRKYKEEDICRELLNIIDDIDRYLEHEDNDHLSNIYSKLISVLESYDVKPIYEERPTYFNSEFDNAVVSVNTTDSTLDNSIAFVMKKGYLYKDKILRYEDVAVNKLAE